MRAEASLLIRRASRADGRELAELARSTFRDTFAGENTPSDMEAYLGRAFSLEAVQADLENPASIFLLGFLKSGEAPIGYAKLKTGSPDPSVRGLEPIEIERLYVGRKGLGLGIGARLMRACLDEAAKAGHKTVWLGVWERNPRAIAFYERWGFEQVGEHSFLLGSDLQNDLIMERAVGESASGT